MRTIKTRTKQYKVSVTVYVDAQHHRHAARIAAGVLSSPVIPLKYVVEEQTVSFGHAHVCNLSKTLGEHGYDETETI